MDLSARLAAFTIGQGSAGLIVFPDSQASLGPG